MRRILPYIFLLGLFVQCDSKIDIAEAVTIGPLIPKPQELQKGEGHYTLETGAGLFVETEFDVAGTFLTNYLKKASISMKTTSWENGDIVITRDSTLEDEGYVLTVSEGGIVINAKDASGAFYGVQTLRQLMPVDMESSEGIQASSIYIPSVLIKDHPTFSYRGMHLDVGRHFFPKEFIKEYIANLSMLKMNYFHWHLTEDQGWRIEIKKYPRLTSHSAYRDETLIGHYSDTPHKFDGTKYGGFYSQEDIKEIVAFATQHNVTIIPEIEMPGHAQAAISAYPELGCAPYQVPVATKWGVFENIYCPNQKTFGFLKDVLTEVIELFPSEYIHIGGDEAPKAQWKTCGHCQNLIQRLDLKDEHGLQSYFIKEIETFLNSKGKNIIGWDEILEGGLAPNATVMSWRGVQGGIDAAQQKHNVIMTPNSHAYFDYYQTDNVDEPLAIGGFLPLKKVYSFNPIPKILNASEATYILGAQGNVWTEYMKDEDKVEYMVFPRILAMSEITWTGPSENIDADYADFLARVEPFHQRLDALDINYANHLYGIDGTIVKDNNTVLYELNTPTAGKEIWYTINNSEEKKYTQPISISEGTQLKAYVVKDGEKVGSEFSQTITYHKAITGSVSLNVEPHSAYNAGGKEALINGINGSDSRYGDSEWLGFWGDDVEITIDFGKETKISAVKTRFYNGNGQWIYAPKKIIVEDGSGIVSSIDIDPSNALIAEISVPIEATTRYLKIRVPNYGTIPKGLQGAGNKAWTFIDEISIE